MLPLLPIPIMPEHIWKDVSEEEVKTYANEPDGRAGGRFRAVPARGGHGGRVDVPVRGEPRLLGRRTPHIDEVVFRVFKARTRWSRR